MAKPKNTKTKEGQGKPKKAAAGSKPNFHNAKASRIAKKIFSHKPGTVSKAQEPRKVRKHFSLLPEAHLIASCIDKPEDKPMRDGFGEALLMLGREKSEVVVLTADLAESTRTSWFAKEFPERFFDFGIAEQNMMAASAGLALSKKIPVAATFAVFAIGRSYDQVRTSICYSRANVKIVSTHAGVTAGIDGATHQMLTDIALARTLPNLIVLSPCDYEQAKKAVIAATHVEGPVYVRLSRASMPMVTTQETPFEIGKADYYAHGSDACIIATGVMVFEALLAAKALESKGISASVLNMHTIKPLDEEKILDAAKTGIVVTAEDHHAAGGLGGAVAEVLAKSKLAGNTKQIFIGVRDSFGMSGQENELMKEFKITSHDIEEAIIIERQKKAGSNNMS